jgi:hypothetical protein
MEKLILNKKEYNSHEGKDPCSSNLFQKTFIQEYCNLNIYPLVGILEREAGLLSDFAEAIIEEGGIVSYQVYGNNTRTEFVKDNLLNFDNIYINYNNVITYIDESIVKVELLKLSEIVLAIPNEFTPTDDLTNETFSTIDWNTT